MHAGLKETPASASPIPTGFRFPRSLRLVSSRHIRQAYEGGERYTGRLMVLWIRRAPDACLRMAVVSSKKVGGAVRRNRARRRVREVFRLHRRELGGEADLVIVCRYGLPKAAWKDVEREFHRLTQAAGLRRDQAAQAEDMSDTQIP